MGQSQTARRMIQFKFTGVRKGGKGDVAVVLSLKLKAQMLRNLGCRPRSGNNRRA